MATEPLFWCVWCEGGGNPTVKHRDYTAAKAEAQRLARQHPGRRFVVLAAAVAFVKRDLDEVRFEARQFEHGPVDDFDDGIPF